MALGQCTNMARTQAHVSNRVYKFTGMMHTNMRTAIAIHIQTQLIWYAT